MQVNQGVFEPPKVLTYHKLWYYEYSFMSHSNTSQSITVHKILLKKSLIKVESFVTQVFPEKIHDVVGDSMENTEQYSVNARR